MKQVTAAAILFILDGFPLFSHKSKRAIRWTALLFKKDKRSNEIAGTTLCSFTLLALSKILDLAILEKSLHLDFATTGTIKTLSCARRTRVLGYLCHLLLLLSLERITKYDRPVNPPNKTVPKAKKCSWGRRKTPGALLNEGECG